MIFDYEAPDQDNRSVLNSWLSLFRSLGKTDIVKVWTVLLSASVLNLQVTSNLD